MATTRLDERQVDLTIATPSLPAPVMVRLLLPAGFDAHPNRRWPVLYLLHGCCDDYQSWTRSTDIAGLSAATDVLVAMPDGGRVGFYSNWKTGPQWEQFHTEELPRLLQQHYRASDRAAVAGVSMGGLGALGYAARHRGAYQLAASFSGIVDTRLSEDTSIGYLTLVRSEGEDPVALWGNPRTHADRWKQHNPFDLAAKLRGTKLIITAGDGRPGPLDEGAGVDTTEQSIGAENRAFADRARKLDLDADIRLYGAGTHNWTYWKRELRRSWPEITAALH